MLFWKTEWCYLQKRSNGESSIRMICRMSAVLSGISVCLWGREWSLGYHSTLESILLGPWLSNVVGNICIQVQERAATIGTSAKQPEYTQSNKGDCMVCWGRELILTNAGRAKLGNWYNIDNNLLKDSAIYYSLNIQENCGSTISTLSYP
jgi:hypothetical protein